MDGRQTGILWRIARLHPAYIGGLGVLSLGVPVVGLAPRLEPSSLGTAVTRLLLLEAEIFSLLLPLLYVYAVVLLVSGRFHARWPRRVVGATICIAILTALVLGIVPMIIVFAMMDDEQARSLAIFAAVPTVAGAVSCCQLLTIASRELESAERGRDASRLRRAATVVAMVVWLPGLMWVQARVRRLVWEFDTGVFSRLPIEAVGFSEDGTDEAIPLTRRVAREHAEAYAEAFARRAGGSITGRRKSAKRWTWDITIDKAPLRLVFETDPPQFTLHTDSDPAEEVLFKTWMRVRGSD